MARTSLARPAQIVTPTLTLIPRDLNSNPDLNSVLTFTPTLNLPAQASTLVELL